MVDTEAGEGGKGGGIVRTTGRGMEREEGRGEERRKRRKRKRGGSLTHAVVVAVLRHS